MNMVWAIIIVVAVYIAARVITVQIRSRSKKK